MRAKSVPVVDVSILAVLVAKWARGFHGALDDDTT